MIQRTFDPSIHDYIGNLPEVYPFIVPDPNMGEVFFHELAAAPDDYVLLHEGSIAASIFEWSAPSIYEAHTMFSKQCRGTHAREVGRAMLDYMFTEMDAYAIWGQTPSHLAHVLKFNLDIGMEEVGSKIHYKMGPSTLVRMDRARWEATQG